MTADIAAFGGQRRRQEQALLRVRGASIARILCLAGIEAAATGVPGALRALGSRRR